MCSVHPRTCGEHCPLERFVRSVYGSSPHVRGTWIGHQGRQLFGRFIPARAGNIVPLSGCPASLPVHPRTCGEHMESSRTDETKHGSSPHVRGTSRLASAQAALLRFIPARAGNIRAWAWDADLWTVHPRTCGEHHANQYLADRTNGSSPHVRGTLSVQAVTNQWARFIPARAGNMWIGTGR